MPLRVQVPAFVHGWYDHVVTLALEVLFCAYLQASDGALGVAEANGGGEVGAGEGYYGRRRGSGEGEVEPGKADDNDVQEVGSHGLVESPKSGAGTRELDLKHGFMCV